MATRTETLEDCDCACGLCTCCGCTCVTWRARINNVRSGPFGGPFAPVDIFNVATGTGTRNIDGSRCDHAGDPGQTLLAELGTDGSGLWLEVSEWLVNCNTNAAPAADPIGVGNCYGTTMVTGRLVSGGSELPGTMEAFPGDYVAEYCTPLLIVAPMRFAFAGGVILFDLEFICDD